MRKRPDTKVTGKCENMRAGPEDFTFGEDLTLKQKIPSTVLGTQSHWT